MMLGISIHYNNMKLTLKVLSIDSLVVILSLFNKRVFENLYSLSINAGIQQTLMKLCVTGRHDIDKLRIYG
jgi:hypothetical protein